MADEAILEPDLPIIDPHHHLWDLRPLIAAFPQPRHPFIETLTHSAYYTFDQLLADARGGTTWWPPSTWNAVPSTAPVPNRR